MERLLVSIVLDGHAETELKESRIQCHFTPTYKVVRNQTECFFTTLINQHEISA